MFALTNLQAVNVQWREVAGMLKTCSRSEETIEERKDMPYLAELSLKASRVSDQ
jgi:hypothetical protein